MDEAISWTIRLRHADAGGWQQFTSWLEADRAHLDAYEELAALDADLDGLPPTAAAAAEEEPEPVPVGWGRRALIGGGAAATLAAAAAWFTLAAPGAVYSVETAPGERRIVALEGGTRIDLNGASRLVLDRDDARFARLERGEALFAVVHRPGDPFRVEAGGAVIRNVGTVFNVLHEGAAVAVEVAEGAITFSADGKQVGAEAGQTVRSEAGRVTTGSRAPATVGGWRDGQLSYSSASFAEIARDLSRSSGLGVRAAPEVASRKFSGVIVVEPDRELMRRRISALLEVDVRLADEGWILAPPDR